MLKSSVLTLLLCLQFAAMANVQQSDSLEARLLHESLTDTSAVLGLVDLAFEFYSKSPQKTLELGRISLQRALALKYTKGVADSHTVLGVGFWTLGMTDSASYHYIEASRAYEQINDRKGVVSIYNNLALINEGLGLADEAMEYYRKAYSIAKDIGFNEGVSNIANNMAIIYLYTTRQYDSALSRFKESLQIELGFKENGRSLITRFNNIGETYLLQKDIDSAQYYFQRALRMSQQVEDNRSEITSLKNLALIHISEKSYRRAESLLLQSLKMSLDKGFHKLIKLNYDELASLYSKWGKHALANQYLKRYIDLKDSLDNVEVKKTIAEIQKKYDAELQQKRISEQKLELARMEIQMMQNSSEYRDNLFMAYLAISLLFSVGAIYYLRQRYLNARRSRMSMIIKLNTLKNQLNPHFLFNSLNVLSSMIHKRPEEADYFIGNLAKLYRYILENFESDYVSLKAELAFAEAFMDVMKVRFGTSIRLDIEVADDVLANYEIPPLAVQILLENAVKHNGFSEEQPLDISISMSSEEYLEVCNNINKKESAHNTHLGLRNLKNIFEKLVKREMIINEDTQYFRVMLPIIRST